MGQLNQSPIKEIPFNDFSGGYAGVKAPGTRKENEAKTLDNVVILPTGAGLRSRNGNDEKILRPAATSLNTLTATLGLAFFEYQGDKWLVSYSRSGGIVSNEVFIQSSNLAATSDNGDSAYPTATYTFSADNLIQTIRVNNAVIGIVQTTGTTFWPPVQSTMSASGGLGSSVLFVGAVAEGRLGIFWNNRLWIGNLTGEQSKLKYSILAASGVSFAASTTWTDSGSGFVEPARGDGDELTALAPISNNVLLYFKKNSVHQIVGRTDPFAVFPLFEGVGAAGRGCAVSAEGLVYFITPDKRMLITDGSKIYSEKDIPALGFAKDLLNGISSSRLYLTLGFRHKGRDFDWIVWMCSKGASSTHDYALIWDRINSCWLQCTTGFNGNAFATLESEGTYIGGYSNARLYKLDATTTYQDDSYSTPLFDGSNRQLVGTNPQAVTWYWQSDDFNLSSLDDILQASEVKVSVTPTTTATIDFQYSYNGLTLATVVSKSLVPTSIAYNIAVFRPLGRGMSFGIKIGGDDNAGYQLNGYSIRGRQQGRVDTNKGLV